MPHPRTADLEALLRALEAAGVPAIVVGGAAAVIHGAPITTQDLDIVPRLDDGDVERLLAVLAQLDARFRPLLPGRDIVPAPEHFAARGQLQLVTRFGPLDILCRLHGAPVTSSWFRSSSRCARAREPDVRAPTPMVRLAG